MQSHKPGGMLYAIGAVGMPYIKIGSTRTSVEKRLQALQTAHPFVLRVLATVAIPEDVRRIEAHVHAFLQHARQRGEWFEVQVGDNAQFEQLIVRAVEYVAEQEALAQARPRLKKAPIDMNALGKRLKLARVARDLTIQQLSALSGVGINQISRLENGEKPGVRVDTLAALVVPLEVSIDHLVGLSDATPVPSAPRLPQAPQETQPPAKRPRTRKAAPVA